MKREVFPSFLHFWLGLLAFYALSHGPQVLYPGHFWDDYQLINTPIPALLNSFQETGRPWMGHLHGFLIQLPHAPQVYHWLTFFLTFGSAALLSLVLRSLPYFSSLEKMFLILAYCLLPYNHARHEMTMVQYVICHFSFLTAVLLAVRWPQLWAARIVGAGLLILSFGIEAHLVFWLALCAASYYQAYPRLKLNRTEFLVYFKRHWDWILIPVFYWIYRSIALKPYGMFLGNNTLGKKNLLLSPLRILESFWSSGIGLWVEFAKITSEPSFYILFGICFIWMSQLARGHHFKMTQKSRLFGVGVFLFAAAAFPFAAVEKIPSFTEDWNSRFQFLLPLGAALILLGGLRWIRTRRLQIGLAAGIIAASITVNFKTELAYRQDWNRQLKLIELFRNDPTIRTQTAFIVEDRARHLNVNQRQYRFYEWTGLMKIAFGEASRYVVPIEDHPVGKLSLFLAHENYRNLFSLDRFKTVDRIQNKLIIEDSGSVDSLRLKIEPVDIPLLSP